MRSIWNILGVRQKISDNSAQSILVLFLTSYVLDAFEQDLVFQIYL